MKDQSGEKPLFGGSKIASIYLVNWLDWCAAKSDEQHIVLPLIQRGSVWRPNQIIDLWDSLLRGLPVGSFMLKRIEADGKTRVRFPGQKESRLLEKEAYGLLDGQQRTLAMMAGWPGVNGMDRRIWVDFADEPGKEHLFRLRVTTENHPFGFQRENPSSKLSVDDRRRANLVYRAEHGIPSDDCVFADFQKTRPFHVGRSLPVDLTELVALYSRHGDDLEAWKNAVDGILESINNYQVRRNPSNVLEVVQMEQKDMDVLSGKKEEVKKNIEAFHEALKRMYRLQVPLILVDLDEVESASRDADKDPGLAILFRRVGSNGTGLSNADYVFSVIKHHCPETHDLVEAIHSPAQDELREYNIAALLAPADIVGAAVRLAAANCKDKQKQPLPDYESIDKNQFSRLLRETVTVGGNAVEFLGHAFLPLINGKDSRGLAQLFEELANLLRYRKDGQDVRDIGLPPHALWLLDRPLIQVLLFWRYRYGKAQGSDADTRKDLIRFVMFWRLCVTNAGKASQLAFSLIRQSVPVGAAILQTVCRRAVEEGHAIMLLAPRSLELLIPNVIRVPLEDSEDRKRPLRGYKRFEVTPGEVKERIEEIDRIRWWKSDGSELPVDRLRGASALYQRWWSRDSFHRYNHPLLLWLQRDYVAQLPGSPVAGREEDTPFDYDHILPYAHWSGQYNGIFDIIRNCGDLGHGANTVIGNSIGNVRVWASAHNRSDGHVSPKVKLDRDNNLAKHLIGSAITEEHYRQWWESCSADGDEMRKWNEDRAIAFQKAVEERAFQLYTVFYNDLKFDDWVGAEKS